MTTEIFFQGDNQKKLVTWNWWLNFLSMNRIFLGSICCWFQEDYLVNISELHKPSFKIIQVLGFLLA